MRGIILKYDLVYVNHTIEDKKWNPMQHMASLILNILEESEKRNALPYSIGNATKKGTKVRYRVAKIGNETDKAKTMECLGLINEYIDKYNKEFDSDIPHVEPIDK